MTSDLRVESGFGGGGGGGGRGAGGQIFYTLRKNISTGYVCLSRNFLYFMNHERFFEGA